MKQKKQYVAIEIMPAMKSCEQGCPHCPLANIHGKKIKQDSIDSEVQESFAVLEQSMDKKGDTGYDLHFTSQINLYPTITNQELLRMARFETARSISEPGVPKEFTDGIKGVIERYHLNPQEVCFSFVPKSPVITKDESKVIRDVIKEIAAWFLKGKKGKTLSCTIRTNFIPTKKLMRLSDELKHKDRDNLNALTEDLFKGQRSTPGRFKVSQGDDIEGSLYDSEFRKKIFGNTIEISNRAMSHTTQLERDVAVKSDSENYQSCFEIEQGVKIARYPPSILLDPTGVMLNHTSSAINNPVMWVSHEDFRRNLLRCKEMTFKKLVKQLILENASIYTCLLKENSLEFLRNVEKDEFMHFYQEHRNLC